MSSSSGANNNMAKVAAVLAAAMLGIAVLMFANGQIALGRPKKLDDDDDEPRQRGTRAAPKVSKAQGSPARVHYGAQQVGAGCLSLYRLLQPQLPRQARQPRRLSKRWVLAPRATLHLFLYRTKWFVADATRCQMLSSVLCCS
jgi:hypothetical protein